MLFNKLPEVRGQRLKAIDFTSSCVQNVSYVCSSRNATDISCFGVFVVLYSSFFPPINLKPQLVIASRSGTVSPLSLMPCFTVILDENTP